MSKESTPDAKDIAMWLKSLPESHDQHSASRNIKQILEDVKEMNPKFQKTISHLWKKMLQKIKPGNYGNNMYLKMALLMLQYT